MGAGVRELLAQGGSGRSVLQDAHTVKTLVDVGEFGVAGPGGD